MTRLGLFSTLGNHYEIRSYFWTFVNCELQMLDEMFLQAKTSYTLRMTAMGWGRESRSLVWGSVFAEVLFYLTGLIFSHPRITKRCKMVSLTQMGDKEAVCHGRWGNVLSDQDNPPKHQNLLKVHIFPLAPKPSRTSLTVVVLYPSIMLKCSLRNVIII